MGFPPGLCIWTEQGFLMAATNREIIETISKYTENQIMSIGLAVFARAVAYLLMERNLPLVVF
jgi:hypothetical protein